MIFKNPLINFFFYYDDDSVLKTKRKKHPWRGKGGKSDETDGEEEKVVEENREKGKLSEGKISRFSTPPFVIISPLLCFTGS